MVVLLFLLLKGTVSDFCQLLEFSGNLLSSSLLNGSLLSGSLLSGSSIAIIKHGFKVIMCLRIDVGQFIWQFMWQMWGSV